MGKILGLKKVSLNNKVDNDKVVLFIHGLSGDAINTWKKKGYKPLHELFSDDPELIDFDIYTYGYRTGIILKQYDIQEISEILTTDIMDMLKEKDIYFIAHSLGGLVVQKTIIGLIDREERDLIDQIKGIVYLSVPFEGAAGGTIASSIGSLVPPILGKWFLSVQILSLKIFSKELMELRKRWNNSIKQRKLPMLKEKAIVGQRDKTVNPFSSRPPYLDDVDAVDETHRTICKIDQKSRVYSIIKSFLKLKNTNKSEDNGKKIHTKELIEVPLEVESFINFIEGNIKPSIKSKKNSDIDSTVRETLISYYLKNFNFIERIKGDKIPIENSYIHLASTKSEGDNYLLPSERERILNNYVVNVNRNLIEPHEIINYSKNALILGTAGIGKTVLCHLLAYKWAKRKVWTNEVEYLFYIPLKVFANEPSQSILQFIMNFYFNELREMISAAQLGQLIEQKKEKVLLIFDGYDELSDSQKNMLDITNAQLTCGYKIFTSRPFGTKRLKVDNEFENIGFNQDDIEKYIDTYFGDESKKYVLSKFLRDNKNINSLSHIPLILELICMIWNKKEENVTEVSSTFTDLYSGVLDIVFMDYTVKKGYEHIWNEMEKIYHVIGFIAFKGLIGKKLFIKGTEIEHWLLEYKLDGKQIFQDKKSVQEYIVDRLLKSGLIRMNTESWSVLRSEFEFLHLTFQEYFAAYNLSMTNEEEFLNIIKTYKNFHYFQLVMIFLSGLISQRNQSRLELYFSCFKIELNQIGCFYDALLGVACLGELESNRVIEFEKNVMKTVRTYVSYIVSKDDESQITMTAQYLKYNKRVLKEIINYYVELGKDFEDFDVSFPGAPNLLSQIGSRDKKVLNLFHDILKNSDVRLNTLRSVGELEVTDTELVNEVYKFLEEENSNISGIAIDTLIKLSRRNIDLFVILSEKLKSEEYYYKRYNLIQVIGEFPEYDKHFRRLVLESFNDKDDWVREYAVGLIGRYGISNDDELELIKLAVKDENEIVRATALMVLGSAYHEISSGRFFQTTSEIKYIIKNALEDESDYVKVKAIESLYTHLGYHYNIFDEALVKLLIDRNSNSTFDDIYRESTREIAASIVLSLSKKDDGFLEVMFICIRTAELGVARAVIKSLLTQADDDERILNMLENELQSIRIELRSYVALILSKGGRSSDTVIMELYNGLDYVTDNKFLSDVIVMFCGYIQSSESILKKYEKSVKENKRYARFYKRYLINNATEKFKVDHFALFEKHKAEISSIASMHNLILLYKETKNIHAIYLFLYKSIHSLISVQITDNMLNIYENGEEQSYEFSAEEILDLQECYSKLLGEIEGKIGLAWD